MKIENEYEQRCEQIFLLVIILVSGAFAAEDPKNHAANGRSTKSFRSDGHWSKVYEQMNTAIKDAAKEVTLGKNVSKNVWMNK